MAGQRIQQYVRDTMTASARRAHVDIRPTLRLYGADSSAVFLQDVLTGDAVVVEEVAALVLAQGQTPEDSLLGELEAAVADGASFEVRGGGRLPVAADDRGGGPRGPPRGDRDLTPRPRPASALRGTLAATHRP